LVRSLWEKGTDCIIDMIVMDTYVESLQQGSSESPRGGGAAEEENISSTWFRSVTSIHSLCCSSRWINGQGIKNSYQYYCRESSAEDGKVILPPLWISSGPTQYHNSQSIKRCLGGTRLPSSHRVHYDLSGMMHQASVY
jgi:hypothetical protein